MTTIANIATRILAETGYTVGDISLTNLEYLIDNAIDYVNLHAGLSIADLAGSAESKSLTGTDGQIFAVKALSELMLRAYKDKGPNIGLGGLNITSTTSDPHYILETKLVNDVIERLKEPPIIVANEPLPNE